MCLLAAEIQASTGKSPSQRYAELTTQFGSPSYKRVDAAATLVQKAKLSKLQVSDVAATELAGESIEKVETHSVAGGALGGVKVSTKSAWFAARPSGTEDVYKIYGESFVSLEHLERVLAEAQSLVDGVISSG